MNTPNSVLSAWQALHNLSLSMLKLAKAGQWDDLITHEITYVQLIEHISQNPITSARGLTSNRPDCCLKMCLKMKANSKSYWLCVWKSSAFLLIKPANSNPSRLPMESCQGIFFIQKV